MRCDFDLHTVVVLMHQNHRVYSLHCFLFFWLPQIKKRDPSFAPHSLLDFGSGVGTVAW